MPDDLFNSFMNGPDEQGRFGDFGGRFVSETLMPLILSLEEEYNKAKDDPTFWAEMNDLWTHYVGRPSPLYHAERLTQKLGGAKVYMKRDELNHTGAHKINNVLDGLRQIWPQVCCLYGRARRGTAGPQCVPHAPVGC